MNSKGTRDDATCQAWAEVLRKHQLLYPDERVVSFLARRFPASSHNQKRRALDIGCGSGRHVKLMLDYGFQTWAIDSASEATEMVHSSFHNNPLFREVILGDFRKDIPPLTFHAIVAWGLLFLRPPSEMVANLGLMSSLLEPEGRLFLNFRTRENFHFGLGKEIEPGCFILDERAGPYKGMCYSFTDLPEVEDLVKRAGKLKIVQIEQTTFVKNHLSELHSWLQVELIHSRQ